MKNKTLLDDFLKYEKLISNYNGKGILDISRHPILTPITLIPLLKFTENKKIFIKNHPNHTKEIYSILTKENINTEAEQKILLPLSMKKRRDLEIVERTLKRINPKYNYYILNHTLNELINNIYEHGYVGKNLSERDYILIHEYSEQNKLDICVIDNGRSIGNSFRSINKNISDCEAISFAISKNSTSKEKEEKDKGNGLWTTINLVVEGNNGHILIVSGKCYLYIESKDKYKYGKLNKKIKGTMIFVRLYNQPFLKTLYGENSILEPNTIPKYKYNGE